MRNPEASLLENHECNFYCVPPHHCDVAWVNLRGTDTPGAVEETLRPSLRWRGLTLLSFQRVNEITPEQYFQGATGVEETSSAGHITPVSSAAALQGYVPYRVMFCVEEEQP